MRYIPDSQPYIAKVIADLGIPHKEFLMDEENEDRPYLLRDYFIQQKNLRTAGKAAYKLNEEEENQTPDGVSQMVFDANVPDDERDKNPDQMITVHDYPLLSYGSVNTYNLVNASDDAINYVIDGNGYSYLYGNVNAAGTIGDSNATARSNGYRTPEAGMERVPIRMAENFTSLGGSIAMNTTVTQIDECVFRNDTKIYLLTTYNYETNETKVYFARKVVLAITRTQLKRIQWDALWTSRKRHLIDSVIGSEANKIFLAFREPWWRKESLRYLNLTQGRTISSLPCRQTFYFTAPDPQTSNNSFIMLYNDGRFARFWSALASPAFKPFPTSSSAIFPMTETLVKEAVREMAINHNTTEDVIGMPYFGWIMAWDPNFLPRSVPGYGPYMPSESWAFWAPEFNFTDVTTQIVKLDPSQDIFICGSMYSLQQGWTEGAFEHADQMLTDHFGIQSFLSSSEMAKLRRSFYAARRIPLYP